jgi:hypothetical protein
MKHLILLVIAACLALDVAASTNLPVAQAATVSINPTTLQFRASGLLESNAIARVNQPILLADLTFSTNTWIEADTNVWTNAAGWSISGSMTNGAIDCYTNALVSPWLSGPGLRDVTPYWSNLYLLNQIIEWTTNDTVWHETEPSADLRFSFSTYKVRIRADADLLPPGATPIAHLARVMLYGHNSPAIMGQTNDFGGIIIRVDNPISKRDAVNLQTLEAKLEAYVPGGATASTWSQHPAIDSVDLAGNSLVLDTRYTLSIDGDTLELTYIGSPVLEIMGPSTCTVRIVSFRLDGTNITADVTGGIGWRPYPEWSTDLVSGVWTTLSTNQFTSTYPVPTNGTFRLTWAMDLEPSTFWRISASNETVGTNGAGLARFSVPVDVPALSVAGIPVVPGVSVVSNSVYALTAGSAATAGYATNAGMAGFATNAGTASYATNSGTAVFATNAGTASYATNAGQANLAAVSLYANESGESQHSMSSTTAGYATNSRYATTAGYATNAGFADSSSYATRAATANYATNSGTAGFATNSGTASYATNAGTASYATNAGFADSSGFASSTYRQFFSFSTTNALTMSTSNTWYDLGLAVTVTPSTVCSQYLVQATCSALCSSANRSYLRFVAGSNVLDWAGITTNTAPNQWNPAHGPPYASAVFDFSNYSPMGSMNGICLANMTTTTAIKVQVAITAPVATTFNYCTLGVTNFGLPIIPAKLVVTQL